MQYEKVGRYFIVPYALFEKQYKRLSVSAKLLYGLFLNRYSLSCKNKESWTDKFGRIYFVFTMQEIRAWFHCSNNKAILMVEELVVFNLVVKTQDKRGTANKFYIVESGLNYAPKQFQNETCRSPFSEPQGV